MLKLLKSRAGFSLVELIVVIIILGILVAIAVPALIGYVNRANIAADIAAADGLSNVASAYYYEKYPNFPATAEDLKAALQTPVNGAAPYNSSSWPKSRYAEPGQDMVVMYDTDGNVIVTTQSGVTILPSDIAKSEPGNPYGAAGISP